MFSIKNFNNSISVIKFEVQILPKLKNNEYLCLIKVLYDKFWLGLVMT